MKIIRTTVAQPRPGSEREVAAILRELGEYLSGEPGFIDGYEFQGEGTLGRVSVWATRQDADRAANLVHTIALRARLHAATLTREESLAEVTSEHHAELAQAQ